MIIFIEGADGTGKTTLINKLANLGYTIETCPPRMESKTAEKQAWRKFLYNFGRRLVICDRGPISEMVYRLVKNEVNTYIDEQLLTDLLAVEIAFIYCYTDNAFELAKARGEDNITDKPTHNRVEQLYSDIFTFIRRFTNIPVFPYNWQINSNGASDIVYFINKLTV